MSKNNNLEKRLKVLEMRNGKRRIVLGIKTQSGRYKIPSEGEAWLDEQGFQRWRSGLGPHVKVLVCEMWMPEGAAS